MDGWMCEQIDRQIDRYFPQLIHVENMLKTLGTFAWGKTTCHLIWEDTKIPVLGWHPVWRVRLKLEPQISIPVGKN